MNCKLDSSVILAQRQVWNTPGSLLTCASVFLLCGKWGRYIGGYSNTDLGFSYGMVLVPTVEK